MKKYLSRETKEALAFVIGAIGFLHELIIAHAERPFLLTASLALMGFPLVFRGDEKVQKLLQSGDSDKSEEK